MIPSDNFYLLVQLLIFTYLTAGTVFILYYSIYKATSIRKQWIKEGKIKYSDNDYPGIVIDNCGKTHIDHLLKFIICTLLMIVIWFPAVIFSYILSRGKK